MVAQGEQTYGASRMLDECIGHQVYEADIEQAQQPLKPSIRPPAEED